MPSETPSSVLERHAQEVVSLPGVVGLAEGETDGKPCINVYVVEASPEVTGRIPAHLEGWPVVVLQSGEVRRLAGEP
jgi:hypothetical protein